MNEQLPQHPGETPPDEPKPEALAAEAAHTPADTAGETVPETPPRVWIGSLADYNNGRLHCDWFDAAVSPDELTESARVVIASSSLLGAEEWAILDYEGFGDFKVGESEDLALVAEVARGVAEHGEAFAAWAELHDGDPTMLRSFTNAFLGAFDSAEAWAETVADDLGIQELIEQALPDDIARYVRLDTAAWAQDAWLGGDIYVMHRPGGGVWIFDSRA